MSMIHQRKSISRTTRLIILLECLIATDRAAALKSGCSGGFCFVTSDIGSEWGSWDSAQQSCSNNGTQLIEITNDGIQSALSSFMNSIAGGSIFRGRTLFTNGKRLSGSWTWLTKSSANSLYIGGESAVDFAYGYLQLTTSRFTLINSRPTDTRTGYICENEILCTSATGFMVNSRCYRSYDNVALSWYDARSRCLSNGGELGSFDFTSQNQGLNVLNGSWLNPSSSYWLGLRREWWTWQGSQTDVKYSNWLREHPSTFPTDSHDCLCLDPGQWKWIECRCGESNPFICFSGADNTMPVMPSTMTSAAATSRVSSTITSSDNTMPVMPSTMTSAAATSSVSSKIRNERSSTPTKTATSPSKSTRTTTRSTIPMLITTTTSAMSNKSNLDGHSTTQSHVPVYAGVGAAIVIILICIIIIIFAVMYTRNTRKDNDQPNIKHNSEQTRPDSSPHYTSSSPANVPANAYANIPADTEDTRGVYAEIALATLNQQEDAAKTEQPGVVYAALEFQQEPNYLEPDKKRTHATDANKVGPMGDTYAMPDTKGRTSTTPGNDSTSHPSVVTPQGDIYALPIKNSKSPAVSPPGGIIYANL